jgi:hypothetical protein
MSDKEVELKVPFKYARMWPREVFYRRLPKPKPIAGSRKNVTTQWLYKTMGLLTQPGVYVLYMDGVPYYVGQTQDLRSSLAAHARVPQSHYFRHWNYFSAFAADKKDLDNIEALLIAALPTASGRKLLKKEPYPAELTEMLNDIHLAQANPAIEPFDGDEDEHD